MTQPAQLKLHYTLHEYMDPRSIRESYPTVLPLVLDNTTCFPALAAVCANGVELRNHRSPEFNAITSNQVKETSRLSFPTPPYLPNQNSFMVNLDWEYSWGTLPRVGQ